MAEEIKEQGSVPKQRKHGKLSLKRLGIILGIVLAVIVIIVMIIVVTGLRNDGKRYAEKLAEQIGVSPETAGKYAHMTLEGSSEYAFINMAAEDCPHLFESKKTVQVSGVTLPQWVIYVQENNNTITGIEYYDYRQLEKYGNGVKTKSHIEPSGITTSMDADAVQHYIGFAPLQTRYTNDGIQEVYKYYYKDQNTNNTVSYLLRVDYVDGLAASMSEEENVFILSVLKVDQN